jgi:hypothetical protein
MEGPLGYAVMSGHNSLTYKNYVDFAHYYEDEAPPSPTLPKNKRSLSSYQSPIQQPLNDDTQRL